MSIVVPVLVILPLLVAIYKYKSLTKGAKVIVAYLFLSGLANLISAYLAYGKLNNLPVLHVYTCLEFLSITYFFIRIIESKRIVLLLKCIAGAFSLLCIFNSCFIQSIYTYNTYTRSIEAVLVLFLSLLYILLKNKTSYSSLRKKSYQWFVAGFLLYFSSSLALFILSNFTFSLSKHYNWILWNFHASLLLIMYFMFTYAFLNEKR
jgi:hypothetical protein